MGVIIPEEFEREKARPLGLVVAIAALGLSSRLGAADERPRASGFLAGRVDRIAESVVPMVIDAIDLDSVLERVDLDAMLARVDVNALLDRVDVDRLLASLDVDALMGRIDIDGILARVDVDALLSRADIGGMMARSTQGVAESGLDLTRRQLVGLDTIVIRFVGRVLRRTAGEHPLGPPSLLQPRESSES